MRKHNAVSLLLVMIFFILRNSSANPTPLDDDPTASQTINAMVEGTELLADIFKYIQVNVDSTRFDNTILELENAIYNLPYDLGIDRTEIYASLTISKNRIVVTRNVLEEAANKLKGYCNDLIELYTDNDVSLELVQYTADEFVKYADDVLGLIDEAGKVYTEVSDQLAHTKGLLKELSGSIHQIKANIVNLKKEQEETHKKISKLRNEIKAILAKQRKQQREYDDARLGVGIGTLGIGLLIAEPVIQIVKNERENDARNAIWKNKASIYNIIHKLDSNEAKLKNMHIAVDKIKSTSQILANNVDTMSAYVSTEQKLVLQWKSKLTAARLDQENVTAGNLKFGIKKMIRKLNALIEACDNYLNHALPDFIQGRK